MKTLLLILAVTAAVPLLQAEPELKGTPNELSNYLNNIPKTVMVTGESEIKVPADKALVTLRVRTENKSLQDAIRQNELVRTKMLAFLTEHGVTGTNVQVSKFSSTPKYGVFSEKAKSYVVENTVRITAHAEKEFQAAAQTPDNWPEVRYEGIEFEHSNKEELKSKALQQACENAVARKKVYEETLGVKLTAKRFSEAHDNVNALKSRYPAPSEISASSGAAPSYSGIARLPSAEEMGISESISSFGEIIFHVQVAVEYAVEGK